MGGTLLDGGIDDDFLVAIDGLTNVVSGGGSDIIVIDTTLDRGTPGLSFDIDVQDLANGDRIDLSGLRDASGNLLDLADLLAAATDGVASVTIALSGFKTAAGGELSGTVEIFGIGAPADLAAASFIFANGPDWKTLLPADLSVA